MSVHLSAVTVFIFSEKFLNSVRSNGHSSGTSILCGQTTFIHLCHFCVYPGSQSGADPLRASGNGHKAATTNWSSAADVGCQGKSCMHGPNQLLDCLLASVTLSTLESVWKKVNFEALTATALEECACVSWSGNIRFLWPQNMWSRSGFKVYWETLSQLTSSHPSWDCITAIYHHCQSHIRKWP